MNRKIYHGTSAAFLPDILQHGLRPRSETKNSNWKHTVESRPDCVYLTTAYPFHFAHAASDGDDLAILEIDYERLESHLLISDEDTLAHALEGRDKLPKMSQNKRSAHYRKISHFYSAEASLDVMGTCAHLGTIPVEAIMRVAIIKHADVARLILGAFDATITPVNYKFMGKQYESATRWLFGDEPVCGTNPRLPRPDILVFKPTEEVMS